MPSDVINPKMQIVLCPLRFLIRSPYFTSQGNSALNISNYVS